MGETKTGAEIGRVTETAAEKGADADANKVTDT